MTETAEEYLKKKSFELYDHQQGETGISAVKISDALEALGLKEKETRGKIMAVTINEAKELNAQLWENCFKKEKQEFAEQIRKQEREKFKEELALGIEKLEEFEKLKGMTCFSKGAIDEMLMQVRQETAQKIFDAIDEAYPARPLQANGNFYFRIKERFLGEKNE